MITIKGVAPDMIANNLEPAYPTHPGEVLKDEIEYRGISQRKLAAEMDVPYTQLNEVLNGKRPVNTEFALLIEAVLDLPAEPLLKMQARYNLIVTKRNGKFIEKLNKARKIAAEL
jgi:addiction module HigA family antidote